jgi:hypothetical protein
MEKKMLRGLPIALAQAAPINHDDLHLHNIIHGKNLRAADQAKKTTFKGTLVRQILFQEKEEASLPTRIL